MSEPETELGNTRWGKNLRDLRQRAREKAKLLALEGDRSDAIANEAQQVLDAVESIVEHANAMAAKLHEHKDSKDQAYRERNVLVALLARLYPAGVRPTTIEGWNPQWNNCVYIDLPTGQISFHYHDDDAHLFQGLATYAKPYDGHSKDDALKRIRDAFGYEHLYTATLIGN
jgi:hypothetical protein